MPLFTRRDALAVGAGALAGTTILGRGGLRAEVAVKDVQPPKFEVEVRAWRFSSLHLRREVISCGYCCRAIAGRVENRLFVCPSLHLPVS